MSLSPTAFRRKPLGWFQDADGMIALSADPVRDGTVVTTKDGSEFLPGTKLWDLGIFTSEVLEP